MTDVERARALLDERDGELRSNIRGDVAALALAFRRLRLEADREARQAHAMWARMEDACERADAAGAALTKERAEHINDVACGERRLIASERDAHALRAALRRLLLCWSDFTSQEMYGEALRAMMDAADFGRWMNAHDAARVLSEAPSEDT